MVAGHEWLSPTRAVGLIAYSASLAACAIRWLQSRVGERSRRSSFGWLGAIQLLLLLDMAGDWRWKLHDFWMREAVTKGVYEERRWPQMLALALLAAMVIVATAWAYRRFRSRVGFAVALGATIFCVALWFCEAISFHFVDALFYRQIGSVMLVSLLWIGLAIATCVGAWLDARGDRAAFWKA